MAANFENFKISPDFPIKFRKSHQISKNYLKSAESYGQKPLGGGFLKTPPPGLNKVNFDNKWKYGAAKSKIWRAFQKNGCFTGTQSFQSF